MQKRIPEARFKTAQFNTRADNARIPTTKITNPVGMVYNRAIQHARGQRAHPHEKDETLVSSVE